MKNIVLSLSVVVGLGALSWSIPDQPAQLPDLPPAEAVVKAPAVCGLDDATICEILSAHEDAKNLIAYAREENNNQLPEGAEWVLPCIAKYDWEIESKGVQAP